jgi:predicted transcriptional regulator
MPNQDRRGRIDIIGDILSCIIEKGNKIKPTPLMYKSNLAHNQMKHYLAELLDKGFIEEINEKGKKMIKTTKKGQDFLSKLSQMKEFQKTFGL